MNPISRIGQIIKPLIPRHARALFRNSLKKYFQLKRFRRVQWGSLRQLVPVSSQFGLDRGTPIDRYYIDNFIAQYANHIHGHVLEIADNNYTQRFGKNKVTISDILHATSENPRFTIIGDLSNAPHIPSNTFDCIIFTQTLQFIYDLPATVATLHRILKPNGTLLATVPGISQISRYDMDRWGDYWRFTALSAHRLFEPIFKNNLTVQSYGNVLIATAFLQGLALEELKQQELNYIDPDYQITITIKATKQGET